MQRGVLVLRKEELEALFTVFDINKFNGLPIYNKLSNAKGSIENEVSISISEDEIERILDEVGPASTDNQILNSGITKMSELLQSFRS